MIVFGLGNPGSRYRSTRHNAGYLLVERFAKRHNKRFQSKPGYRTALVMVNNTTLRLIKPQCYMNESGIAIRRILTRYTDTFLVVIDDVNLPLGRIRLRQKGSDGGHNGLRSIISELENSNFPRLRIGVGRSDEDLMTYVLSRFKRHEKGIVTETVNGGIKGIKILIRDGMTKAQNYINSINFSEIN